MYHASIPLGVVEKQTISACGQGRQAGPTGVAFYLSAEISNFGVIMRNPSLPLSAEQAAVVARWSEPLYGIIGDGQTYRVEYTKRDGTESVATGPITEVKGKDSTLAIMVADDSKPYVSTVNVYNVIAILS